MNIKKILVGAAVSALMLSAMVVPALAAGAQKIPWNLSATVMPVPPYGSGDIKGSDTASKLIFNQPNGKVKAMVTGVMNGLNPNTTYTVYLSNAYDKYSPARFASSWIWTVLGTYNHDVYVTLNPDGSFLGTGGYPFGSSPYTQPGQTTETITGQVTGSNVTLTTTYNGPYNPGYSVTATGVINGDGSMSGSSPWSWTTSAGAYIPASGNTGWSGLLSGVSTFTFTTDENGSGSWHYNFMTLPPDFSVWVNGGGRTILISDTIEVE